ncbi:guanylyltransferase [Myxococcota bacterium]|nr:guanylyltransferase [Myxococcota bacterium]MBU1432952.1 guanylyltransferase [Myxococcota bacterium]MBU1896306.1 guanylyltransferase [Myxococcota bacterium]
MKFDDLDLKMRRFETAHDHCVLPEMWMVARLDGRGFTKLTKETGHFEAPFDVRFRDLMVSTTQRLMLSGLRVLYGYTESDEISLLLAKDEGAFGRKLRKLNSVLAGEASAHFSLAFGAPGVFDCRISQLPTDELVVDYFRWRNEDAHRNALNAHCYWALREEGRHGRAAHKAMEGRSIAEKNELLFQRGINFNDVPSWQKRGVGLRWIEVEHEGFNPKTQERVITQRRRLEIDYELPMREAYSEQIRALLATPI